MSEREYIQHGVKCDHCGESIYSNGEYDFVTCDCGMWELDRGFEPDVRGPGVQISDIKWISRKVVRSQVPPRYRDERRGVA